MRLHSRATPFEPEQSQANKRPSAMLPCERASSIRHDSRQPCQQGKRADSNIRPAQQRTSILQTTLSASPTPTVHMKSSAYDPPKATYCHPRPVRATRNALPQAKQHAYAASNELPSCHRYCNASYLRPWRAHLQARRYQQQVHTQPTQGICVPIASCAPTLSCACELNCAVS